MYWINPDRIKHKTTSDTYRQYAGKHFSTIDAGPLEYRPVTDMSIFQAIHERFRDDIPWKETSLYQSIRSNLRNNSSWSRWGCESLDEFQERFKYIEEIHDSIKTDGYKTHRELINEGVVITRYPPEVYEITVFIDEDGTFILHEGRHRFSIARALELDVVPVRIMIRHEQWQKLREIAISVDNPEDHPLLAEHIEHPDIQSLLDS